MNNEEKCRRLSEMTEESFRHKVIHPLFINLGYTGYKDLHGHDERGVDAICIDIDKLGNTQLIAIQTKRGNLNMGSKASGNVENLITQARTALNTKISLVSAQQKRYPDKLFCIASGKINRKAQEHIIEQVEDRRIDFLDAEQLIDLIDEYCPEIWSNIPATLIAYYDSITKRVEGYDPHDVLSVHADTNNFIGIHVYRHVPRQKGDHQFFERDEQNISELIKKLDAQHPTLIVADAGAGKSTLLWRMAYLIADNKRNQKEYIIPIIFNARDAVRHTETEHVFWNFCYEQTCTIAGDAEIPFSSNKIPYKQVLLLIDALDEIGEETLIQQFVDNVTQWSQERGTRLCCTSRTIPSNHRFARIYYIDALSLRQAVKLFSKTVSGKLHTSTYQRRLEKIAQDLFTRLGEAYDFFLSPLLVNIYAETADLQRSDIPPNITELFDKYCETMLGRWDTHKGISQQFLAPFKKVLLGKIAFDMHVERRWEMPEEDFKQYIKKYATDRGLEIDNIDTIYNEIYHSRMVTRIRGSVSFTHPLLQEFFAGIAIPDTTFLKKHIKYRFWSNPIMFYFGSHPQQTDLLRQILTKNIKEESRATLLRTAGISLQACYMAIATEKLEIWQRLIALLTTDAKFFHASLSDTLFPLLKWGEYFWYMHYAVPLSLLKQSTYFEQVTQNWQDDDDEFLWFWRLIAMISSDMLTEVEEKKLLNKITTPQLLFPLHILLFDSKTRAQSGGHKQVARRLLDKAYDKMTPGLRSDLIDEIRRMITPVLTRKKNLTDGH